MEAPPIFLLLFANDSFRRLSIEKERRIIEQHLTKNENLGQIVVKSVDDADLDSVWDQVQKYQNRIEAVHFGGHSGGEGLDLLKVTVKGENLVVLLSLMKNLKFVFLNGCNNQKAIHPLLDLKKEISLITTSARIFDTRAVELADLFYGNFSNGNSIASAFDFAASKLNNIERDPIGARSTQGQDNRSPGNHHSHFPGDSIILIFNTLSINCQRLGGGRIRT